MASNISPTAELQIAMIQYAIGELRDPYLPLETVLGKISMAAPSLDKIMQMREQLIRNPELTPTQLVINRDVQLLPSPVKTPGIPCTPNTQDAANLMVALAQDETAGATAAVAAATLPSPKDEAAPASPETALRSRKRTGTGVPNQTGAKKARVDVEDLAIKYPLTPGAESAAATMAAMIEEAAPAPAATSSEPSRKRKDVESQRLVKKAKAAGDTSSEKRISLIEFVQNHANDYRAGVVVEQKWRGVPQWSQIKNHKLSKNAKLKLDFEQYIEMGGTDSSDLKLYAAKTIPKNTYLGEYGGKLVLTQSAPRDTIYCCQLQSLPDWSVDATELYSHGAYLGAALKEADGNVVMQEYFDEDGFHYRLFSLREIKKGEQLSIWCGKEYAQWVRDQQSKIH